jgi:glycosyltransferase involved in cell wall biosynthesis
MEAGGAAEQVMQIAFVLWNGNLGGAETFSCYLAAELRLLGVDARVVFVQGSDPLAARLGELSVPWTELDFPRGRTVLRRPRAYAKAVRGHGRDGAVLMCAGYLATSLRLGGYRGRIVAVEHGTMLLDSGLPWSSRRFQTWDRAVSARAIDVEIGVSGFMLGELLGRPHARDVRCIPYGIAVDRFRPTCPLNETGALRVGWAGRMIPGKGADHLLEAVRVLAGTTHTVHTRIAGDGPMKAELRERSERLGLGDRVEFVGRTQDMPAFWNACDLAVASSSEFIESFGLTPLEAAACGRPAIVSRRGGLVETVADGETGSVVPAGDPGSLAAAIGRYAADRRMLQAHGQAARDRAVREFAMARSASAYLAAVAQPV